MNTRTGTKILVWSTVVIWIVWDVYVAIEQGTPHGDTESELIRDIANSHPFFPWAVGVLMGHFFWNTPPDKVPDRKLAIVLAVIGAIVLVLDFTSVLPALNPILYFVAGIPLGHFLWAQKLT